MDRTARTGAIDKKYHISKIDVIVREEHGSIIEFGKFGSFGVPLAHYPVVGMTSREFLEAKC